MPVRSSGLHSLLGYLILCFPTRFGYLFMSPIMVPAPMGPDYREFTGVSRFSLTHVADISLTYKAKLYNFFDWNIQKIPLGKLRALIEPIHHLKERRNEHEQGRSSQWGSQGRQHKKRGQGSGWALKKKDTVTLIGFGTFKVAQRKARKGVNPQTGAEIKIKAKKVPRFVPGKALKDAVG